MVYLASFKLLLNSGGSVSNWFLRVQEVISLGNKLAQVVVVLVEESELVHQVRYLRGPRSDAALQPLKQTLLQRQTGLKIYNVATNEE